MVKNKESGIYRITNKITKQVYIGSTVNRISNRLRSHKVQLEKNKHINTHFQNSWNKYGSENFEFSILESGVPKELIYERENYYMSIYQVLDSKKGFNFQPAPGGKWVPPKYNSEKADKVSKYYVPDGYIVTTPAGVEEEVVNLTKYCRNNNLSEKCLYDCLVGRQSTHKGYKARYVDESRNKEFVSTLDNKTKPYVVYSPTGERFEVTNLRQWLIERDMLNDYTGFVQSASKTDSKKTHKNWQCYFPEDDPKEFIHPRYLKNQKIYLVTTPRGEDLEMTQKEAKEYFKSKDENWDNLYHKVKKNLDTPTRKGYKCKLLQ